jgi:hypothetical protein
MFLEPIAYLTILSHASQYIPAPHPRTPSYSSPHSTISTLKYSTFICSIPSTITTSPPISFPHCCSFSCYITCTQHLCKQDDLLCFQEGGIMQYMGARWLGDAEAMYHIFHFHTHKEWPPMERLPIHLPDRQLGVYGPAEIAMESIRVEGPAWSNIVQHGPMWFKDKEEVQRTSN